MASMQINPLPRNHFPVFPCSTSTAQVRPKWMAIALPLGLAVACVLASCIAAVAQPAPEAAAPVAEAATEGTPALPDPALAAGKSAFLTGVGEELAAPMAALVSQQQEALGVLQQEVAQSRAETAALTKEVTALRTELSQLRETLDLLVRQVVADLEQENKALRDSAASRAADAKAERMLQQINPPSVAPEALPEPESEGPPLELPVEVVEEWGRSPEDAAALGKNASTLKGLVGVVPEGGRRGDLEQLGRDLRDQYDGFDNINIEVFDNREAAEAYAEKQTERPAHRVLSISKHAASGRDSIVVFVDGMSFEVQ